MQEELLMHFTDDKYCDDDDIRRETGIHNVEAIMNKQLKYRSLYAARINLKNNDSKNFCLCMSPGIVYRFVNFEREFSKLSLRINSLSKGNKLAFRKEFLLKMANELAIFNKIRVDEEYLKYLIDEPLDVEQNVKVIYNYISIIKNIYNNEYKLENSLFFKRIFAIMTNYSNYIDDEPPYRDEERNVKIKDYNLSFISVNNIETCINDLVSFNKDTKIFNSLKAIVSFFYFIYTNPFDCFNDEISLLILKQILGDTDESLLSAILPLEDIMYEDKEISECYLKSILSRDLTYFVLKILSILESKLSSIRYELDKFPVNEENDLIIPKNDIVRKEDTKQNYFTFNQEKKVSLPTIPTGLNEQEAALIVDDLQELYPSLKHLQVVFYTKHCTLGKYYTIAQYKKEMNVVYETARTSMDNLAAVGLYKKEFVGNKFVYTPINKEEE